MFVNKDPGHAQRLGHGTGMLRSRSTKASEGMGCNIKALHLRQIANGPTHGFIGNLQIPVGQFFDCFRCTIERIGRSTMLQSQFFECRSCQFDRQWFIFVGSKDGWKFSGQDAAQHDIGIRHGQQSTLFLVTDGSWIGATRFGSHDEHAMLPKETRPTPGCHRMDIQLRRLNGNTGRDGFQDMFVGTIRKATHIGRCAAHIKTNDWLIGRCCFGISNDTARRTT
mmetsp:Transcript_15263/g.25385  ORF Transcript_15263/g.25385 Transcript_15263/m.25385 type:complete len:224 (+) Transcript_15263:2312-2983(+)